MKIELSSESILNLLNVLYEKSCDGISKASPSIEIMANSYLMHNNDIKTAAKRMIKNQTIKCTASGVITGFGGLVSLPVTIPANMGSVLYEQLRMIACCAYLGGYDPREEEVQTFVYACLAGISVNSIAKKFGIKFSKRIANNAIEKIPGKVLTKINQKLGFRFITKFGEHGLVNLGKMVPGVGAVVNGGFDYAETKAIGNRAFKMFIQNDFSVGEKIEY